MKVKYMIYTALIHLYFAATCPAAEKKLGSNTRPISFGSDQTIVNLNKISWEPLNPSS